MTFLIFFIQRLLATIPLLLAITLVSFALIQAMPGDYASKWKRLIISNGSISEEIAEEQAQQLREKLGLDKPVFVQYFIWIKNIFLAQRTSRLKFCQNVPTSLCFL